MLSDYGAGGHIGGPGLMPNATQTIVYGQGVGSSPHHHPLVASRPTRKPVVHSYMNAGAPSSILMPEFPHLEVIPFFSHLVPSCKLLPHVSCHGIPLGPRKLLQHHDYRLYFYCLLCFEHGRCACWAASLQSLVCFINQVSQNLAVAFKTRKCW